MQSEFNLVSTNHRTRRAGARSKKRPDGTAAHRTWSEPVAARLDHPLTPREVDDVYSLRAVLEGFCASCAAIRLDDDAIAQLAEVHEEFERRGRENVFDLDPLIRLNGIFHEMIVAGAGNGRAADLYGAVTDLPPSLEFALWRARRTHEVSTVYHREIVEAIRAHDAVRAEAVTRSHVYAVKEGVMEQMRADGIQRMLDGNEE